VSVIDVADLKAHLNITTDSDDALLADKIAAAEGWIAAYTGEDCRLRTRLRSR